MRDLPPLESAQEQRRRESLQRLAASAALESAGYKPVQAWDLAGKLPTEVQLQLFAAGRNPISDARRREVAEILKPQICKVRAAAAGDPG